MLAERILVSHGLWRLPEACADLPHQESDTTLYKPALDQIKDFIKTSTSSMTAVPKPLKFLRPHYADLEKAYTSWPEGENKVGGSCIIDSQTKLTPAAIVRRHDVRPRHDLLRRGTP
jgi:hypothetical protein